MFNGLLWLIRTSGVDRQVRVPICVKRALAKYPFVQIQREVAEIYRRLGALHQALQKMLTILDRKRQVYGEFEQVV